jgi:hypothetical protein
LQRAHMLQTNPHAAYRKVVALCLHSCLLDGRPETIRDRGGKVNIIYYINVSTNKPASSKHSCGGSPRGGGSQQRVRWGSVAFGQAASLNSRPRTSSILVYSILCNWPRRALRSHSTASDNITGSKAVLQLVAPARRTWPDVEVVRHLGRRRRLGLRLLNHRVRRAASGATRDRGWSQGWGWDGETGWPLLQSQL